MPLLSETKYGQEWLENFDAPDKKTASLLIDRLMLVGSSDFVSALVKETEKIAQDSTKKNETIALYAEREMPEVNHEVTAFFPGTETGRATGAGIQPVTVDLNKQDVGSEGIIAALITKFCKGHPSLAFSHPGPDTLRKEKVRKIIIITDFIGSGQRIYGMLDAFEKVATVQSWLSYHLISFHVLCYSGTQYGISTLLRHPLKPEISCHVACPEMEEAFSGRELGAIKELCSKYPKKSKWPLGFNSTGALIAFAHGIPNNAPSILHSSDRGWKPLFRGRSTLFAEIDKIADKNDLITKLSAETIKIRDARACLRERDGEVWLHTMLILDAIKRRIKTAQKLSAYCSLPLSSVESILDLALEAKWLTPALSLTALGRSELKYSRWYMPAKNYLVEDKNTLYFPTQLRAYE